MSTTCQPNDACEYQVVDPTTGDPSCSHADIGEAMQCAAAQNNMRDLKDGAMARDAWCFIRRNPGECCRACGHPKAA